MATRAPSSTFTESPASLQPPSAATLPTTFSSSKKLQRPPRCPDSRQYFSLFLFLLPCLSVLYFILLPERPLISQGVYLDENALMVPNTHPTPIDDWTPMDRMEKELRTSSFSSFLTNQFHHLPLTLYQFDLDENVTSSDSSATPVYYTIWRAPKGDGKECLVLVTNYLNGSPDTVYVESMGMSGPTLLLSLIQTLSQAHGYQYFHKDIILVFVPDDVNQPNLKTLPVRAFGRWMDAYKSSDASIVRAGTIMATFALDIPTKLPSDYGYHSFSLDAVGLFGLLPNLDTPSVLLRVFGNNDLRLDVAESTVMALPPNDSHASQKSKDKSPSLFTAVSSFLATHAPFLSKSYYSSHTMNDWSSSFSLEAPAWLLPLAGVNSFDELPLHGRWSFQLAKFKGLWRFMIQALCGGLDSAGAYHSHGLKYAIDSITIRAVPTKQYQSKQDTMRIAIKTVHSLETTLRAFNHLIEKLHHSTYWYLLNNRDDFTTMSKYIYAAVLGLVGFPLCALIRLYTFPTSQQHWSPMMGLLGWIYFLCGVAYGSPILFISLVGGGEWNSTARSAWASLCLVELVLLFVIIRPRYSLLNSSPSSYTSSTTGTRPLGPIAFLVDSSKDFLPPLSTSAAAAGSVIAKASPIEVAPRPVELPFSPAYLPLLPPALSLTTLPPQFTSDLDWRIFDGLLCLMVTIVLVPIMVINFSCCLLTLTFLVPIFLAPNPMVLPTRWYASFSQLRNVNGSLVNLHTTLVWELLKYVVRLVYHLLVLTLLSPITLILLYAQFHGLSFEYGLESLLTYLPLSPGNLLYYTFFFAYTPVYLASILQLTCRFQYHTTTPTAQQLKKQE